MRNCKVDKADVDVVTMVTWVDTITSGTDVTPRDPINHHSSLCNIWAPLNSKSVLESKGVWKQIWEGWAAVQSKAFQYLDTSCTPMVSFTTGRYTPV